VWCAAIGQATYRHIQNRGSPALSNGTQLLPLYALVLFPSLASTLIVFITLHSSLPTSYSQFPLKLNHFPLYTFLFILHFIFSSDYLFPCSPLSFFYLSLRSRSVLPFFHSISHPRLPMCSYFLSPRFLHSSSASNFALSIIPFSSILSFQWMGMLPVSQRLGDAYGFWLVAHFQLRHTLELWTSAIMASGGRDAQGQMSQIQRQIQQDWANREYIELMTCSIKKITDFLNAFGM